MATILLTSFMTFPIHGGAMIRTSYYISICTSKLEEKAPLILVSLIVK